MLKQITKDEAFQKLSALCARKEYCIADLNNKMYSWTLSDDEKADIIDHLIEEGYIDELRYAKAFTHDKFHYNHWGEIKIRFELAQRHISSKNIDTALQDLSEEDRTHMLLHLIEIKKKETTDRTKLPRYLASKGFSYDEIMDVL